ncbi:MAG: SDR family oxidoreductase [Eubacterium sp.]|nr:SDR family oxidoreductase [Eubacterium sp.]
MDINKLPFEMPSYDLTGKVAVVTGGTKGIGYGIAVTLAYFGAKVVLTSRHQDDCDKVAAEINEAGGEAIGIQTDVQSTQQVNALIEKTVEAYGGIDILVNNAGMAVTKFAVDITEDDYNNVMDSNLRSVYFGCQAAAKQMISQGRGGSIINIASIGGLKGSNALSTYGASKAAVINLTKDFAIEWGRYNIRVNALCPGYVKTAMNMEALQDPAYVKRTLKSIPLKRFGEISEVASIVAFLASDASSIMTGTAVVADMGATLE